MIRTLLLSGLALGIATATSFPEEEDVLVLTEETFADAIAEHDPLLVEFYAPWCGHCKSLAPHYAAAASALKSEDPAIHIAKVDATEEGDLASEYGIRGFPTLKLFQAGKVSDYEGGRTEADIVSFMKKRAGPACKTLESVEAAEELVASAEVSIIGFVSAADSEEATALGAVALGQDDVACGITTSADVASHYEVSTPATVLFKDFDEGRVDVDAASLTDSTAIEAVVVANLLPKVIKFDQGLGRKLFGGPVQQHLLVFVDEDADYFEDVHAALAHSADEHQGEALHVYVPKTEDRVIQYFGFSADDLPAVVLADMSGEGAMKKFIFEAEEITGESLSAFISDFTAGNLKPFLKSAEPEDDADEPVKVIVGKTFQERVVESTADVLLEFYAPWCGHCKSLAPTYEQLAEDFESVDSVMIAKMDATANEIDGPAVKGFPTIYFFPGNDKANPVVYDGARDVEGFTEFLRTHATTSFELDGVAGGPDAHDEL